MPGTLSFSRSALLLVLILCCGFFAEAQVNGKIYVDQTSSLAAPARQAALAAVSQNLAQLTRELGITAWEFAAFSDDGWTAQPFFKTSLQAFQAPDCASSAPPSEAGKWFKGVRESELRSSAEKCQNSRREYAARFERELQDKLAPAQEALAKERPVKASSCTAFWDVIEGAGFEMRPTLAVVMSDGVDSCRSTPPRLSPPIPQVQVFVLLVPSTRPFRRRMSQAEQFESQRDRIHHYAPWVNVVPVAGFSPATIKELFREQHSTQAALDPPKK